MCKSKPPAPSAEEKALLTEQKELVALQRQLMEEEAATARSLLEQQEAIAEKSKQEMADAIAKMRKPASPATAGGGMKNFFTGAGVSAMSGGGEATSLLRRVS